MPLPQSAWDQGALSFEGRRPFKLGKPPHSYLTQSLSRQYLHNASPPHSHGQSAPPSEQPMVSGPRGVHADARHRPTPTVERSTLERPQRLLSRRGRLPSDDSVFRISAYRIGICQLPAGGSGVLFMDVTLAEDAMVPRALKHRFQAFRARPNSVALETDRPVGAAGFEPLHIKIGIRQNFSARGADSNLHISN